MGTLTMKFGGSAVGTTDSLTQVVSIVLQERENWDRLIVVISALEGVTDALIEAAHLAGLANRRGYRRIVGTLRTRHLALIERLALSTEERSALEADVDALLFEMLEVSQSLAASPADVKPAAEQVDAIVGVGERLAARILAALLRDKGVRGVAIDATSLIVTDETFGNAIPDVPATQARVQRDLVPLLQRDIVPVVTGFIGSTPDGRPTTLGRGGSDYTASLLGICTASDEVWMWTDVDGMMSADPGEIATAQVIAELSYQEAAELSYFGARILHSRMIAPLRDNIVPLRVKNVYRPRQHGTLITVKVDNPPTVTKAVAAIQAVTLWAERVGALDAEIAVANRALAEVTGTVPDVMMVSQSSQRSRITFVLPTSVGPDAGRSAVIRLKDVMGSVVLEEAAVWTVEAATVVTAIGQGLGGQPRLMARVLAAIDDLPTLGMVHSPAGCSVSVVVRPELADLALHRLHTLTTQPR